MDKEFIDGYVKMPYDDSKYIGWTKESELEMIVKKKIDIPDEIIADESIDIIKYVEDKMKSETEHYKQQRDELSEKLDKECNDNYKLEGQLHDMTKQRDSLIKDVEKLREEKAAIEMYLDAIKTYKPMYECVHGKYKYLTNYIKDKALHNPSVSRYIDLVHVIDELERDTHEG